MAGGRPRNFEQGLPPRVYLKSGTLYYVHKTNRWENLGKDLATARVKAAAYSSAAPVAGSMATLFTAWLVELAARVTGGSLAARTQKDYIDAVDKLTVFFGKMDPVAIQPKHIGEYLDIGREMGRGVRANREKAALSSCFTWLIRTGVVSVNPCVGIKRNTETKRDRWISDEEYHAVYDIAGKEVRCFMVLLYRTMQRPGDILAWTYNNIISRDGVNVLEFRQSKTGRLMSIALNSEIELALESVRRPGAGKDSPLLAAARGGKRYTEMGISSMFRRHLAATKVKDFAPYDLKAKGATDMYKSGVSLEVICALCGHESTKTTEIYIKTHARATVEANSRVVKRV